MKWKDQFRLGEYISAKQEEKTGIWYLSHPDESGKSKSYSSGIKCSKADFRKHLKESSIQEIVEVGIRTRLTGNVIAQITGRGKAWATLIEEWREWQETTGMSPRTIKRNLEGLRRFLREEKLESAKVGDITEKHIYHWLNETLTCKLSTRKVLHQSIRGAWKFFSGQGYADRNIASNTGIRYDKLTLAQKEPKVINAFTSHEFNRLVSAMEMEIDDIETELITINRRGYQRVIRRNSLEKKLEYLRFFYSASHISYAIGLRRSDVAQLEWDSITLNKGWFIVYTEKSDARIAIPYLPKTIKEFLRDVDPEIRAAVEEGLNDAAPVLQHGIDSIDQSGDIDLQYCFPKAREEWLESMPKISVYFKRLLDRNGFNGKSFHCLRHSRIRRWNKLGISLDQIGKFVGHRNTKTTEGYL